MVKQTINPKTRTDNLEPGDLRINAELRARETKVELEGASAMEEPGGAEGVEGPQPQVQKSTVKPG